MARLRKNKQTTLAKFDLVSKWTSLVEWEVSELDTYTYIVKIGTVMQKHTQNCVYKDQKIELIQLLTAGSKLILGYLILVKKDKFKILNNKKNIAFLSNVSNHYNPNVIYVDAQMYAYRFNGPKNSSYWFMVRS